MHFIDGTTECSEGSKGTNRCFAPRSNKNDLIQSYPVSYLVPATYVKMQLQYITKKKTSHCSGFSYKVEYRGPYYRYCIAIIPCDYILLSLNLFKMNLDIKQKIIYQSRFLYAFFFFFSFTIIERSRHCRACETIDGAAAPPVAEGGGVFTLGVIAVPLPLHSRSGKEKKKLFCIEGINSRHLVVARN